MDFIPLTCRFGFGTFQSRRAQCQSLSKYPKKQLEFCFTSIFQRRSSLDFWCFKFPNWTRRMKLQRVILQYVFMWSNFCFRYKSRFVGDAATGDSVPVAEKTDLMLFYEPHEVKMRDVLKNVKHTRDALKKLICYARTRSERDPVVFWQQFDSGGKIITRARNFDAILNSFDDCLFMNLFHGYQKLLEEQGEKLEGEVKVAKLQGEVEKLEKKLSFKQLIAHVHQFEFQNSNLHLKVQHQFVKIVFPFYYFVLYWLMNHDRWFEPGWNPKMRTYAARKNNCAASCMARINIS